MKLFLAIALFFSTFILRAQEEEIKLKLRHIRGLYGVDLNFGISKYGYAPDGCFIEYLSDRFFFQIGANAETGKIGLTDYTSYRIFPKMNYTFFKIRDFLFINGSIGGFAGEELSSNSELGLSDDLFIYGISTGLNFEWYILNRLALIGGANQMYTSMSKFGNWNYQAFIGIRVIKN